MRNLKFKTGNYYHIYNRGVDHRVIFGDEFDFARMIRSMRDFNSVNSIGSIYEKDYLERENSKIEEARIEAKLPIGSLASPALVEIICYCLNKNHFHFLLRQIKDNGVSIFLHKIGTGYTKYINYKYKRKGSLFETTYQAALLNTQEKIIRASAYINGNPEIHKICSAEKWLWSSYRDYLGLRKGTMCHKEMILNEFKSIEDYREFVKMIIVDERKMKDELATMEGF